jgi:hypothetical protein
MSDDPFADGGFDDEQDGGDVFGDSTNNVGEDVFGVTEEQNTGDPFGDDLGDSEPAQEYTSVNNDEGDLMGGPFADNSGEQKAEIPAPAPAVPEEEDCSALNAWRTEWRSQLEAKAAEALAKKNERRQAAEEERRGMTDARNKALAARAEGNRQEEMSFLEERERLAQPGANPWERVVSLIDTKVDDLEKAKATERMRTILIHMKGQQTGPGIN